MISNRRTPKEKTSVFSSTIPCIKYSGAKYPNVPSIGNTAWFVHLLGSHFARPKSEIYTYNMMITIPNKWTFKS